METRTSFFLRKCRSNHWLKNKIISMKEKKAVRGIGRGEFIKKAAMATAGFYIVPRFVLGGKGFTAPSDKLYIAAVGCGGEAENDIRHFATARSEIRAPLMIPHKDFATVLVLPNTMICEALPFHVKSWTGFERLPFNGPCPMSNRLTTSPKSPPFSGRPFASSEPKVQSKFDRRDR